MVTASPVMNTNPSLPSVSMQPPSSMARKSGYGGSAVSVTRFGVPECQVLWPNGLQQSPQTILRDVHRPKDLWPRRSTPVASQGNSLSVILNRS